MTRYWLSIGVLLLVVDFLVGCATPAAAPSAPVALAPAQPPPAPEALTPEEGAWQEVVVAAKKEGEERRLIAYSVHIFGDMEREISMTFFERTGIRVETVSSASSATLIEKIKAERRAGLQMASVQTGAGVFVLAAKQDGLTEKMGYIPEIRDERIYRFDPKLDKDGHMLSQMLLTMSPWVNTKLVQSGTEPRAWRDLLKPEWKGKIGIANPDTAPNAIYIFYGLTSRGKLNQAYFTELARQDLQFSANVGLSSAALARGDVPLIFSSAAAANSLGPFLREGAPLKPIDMAEGIPIYRSGAVALLQGAPSPNAGRVFINWLFSKEGQSIYGKYSLTTGFRNDVPSFISPQGQLTPANPIMMTLEDELEIAKIQKERILTKILRGG